MPAPSCLRCLRPLFGLGLLVFGMPRPSKVVGFLNATGDRDPSLAFVMTGAIAVHFVA